MQVLRTRFKLVCTQPLPATAKQLDSQACSLGIAMQDLQMQTIRQLQCVSTRSGRRGQIGIPGQCFDQGLQEAIVVDNMPHIQDATHSVSLACPCITPRLYSDIMQHAHP